MTRSISVEENVYFGDSDGQFSLIFLDFIGTDFHHAIKMAVDVLDTTHDI